jgi:hypothetical protein
VKDYAAGTDRIDLTTFGFQGYADVHAHMSEANGNVVVNFGHGDKLVIADTTIATLDAHAGDFLLK